MRQVKCSVTACENCLRGICQVLEITGGQDPYENAAGDECVEFVARSIHNITDDLIVLALRGAYKRENLNPDVEIKRLVQAYLDGDFDEA